MVAYRGVLVTLGFSLAWPSLPHAWAVDPPARAAACNQGGTICETATNGRFTDFTVTLTGPNMADIPGTAMTGTASREGHGGFPAKLAFPVAPGPRAGVPVCDARNVARIRSAGLSEDMAGTSILNIESLFYNTTTGLYELEGIFGLVGQTLGDGVPLHIPDLFGDTNGNGRFDDGDVLYSLVDLRTYIVNPPTFGDTQTFQIVNGQVAALPGMYFSTTPFTFSPASGVSGTPFTGEGEVGSFHTIMTPEPSAAVLLLLGAAWMTAGSVRRKDKLWF